MSEADKDKRLYSQYLQCKTSAKDALEVLRQKTLVDGKFYYIGINRYDGWLEIFKGTNDAGAEPLPAEEIEKLLAEKGLYIMCTKSGWMTIRKVPKYADNLFSVQRPDEN